MPEDLHEAGPHQLLLLGRQVNARVLVHQLTEPKKITVREFRTMRHGHRSHGRRRFFSHAGCTALVVRHDLSSLALGPQLLQDGQIPRFHDPVDVQEDLDAAPGLGQPQDITGVET